MKLISTLSFVALVPLILLACGGSDDKSLPTQRVDDDGDEDSGEGGSWGEGAGGTSVGGFDSGGSDAVGSGGSSADGFSPFGMCAVGEAPGVPVIDSNYIGRGTCFEKTLAEVIAEVHEKLPELANVSTLYENADDGFESAAMIYAFEKANGAFQLAFFQGSGDCPAGCIDRNWTYVDTDEDCEPQRVGSFSSVYAEEGNCFGVSGTPMWGKPQARPSTDVCEVEGVVADFGGTYEVPFVGTRTPCTDKGGDSSEEPVRGVLTLTIEQDPLDPNQGIATFSGDDLDPAWLGDEPYQVRFDYYQAQIASQWSNLPAMCAESRDVNVVLDFEGCSPSEISMFEARETVCGVDLCKGGLELRLDLSGVQLTVRD